MLTWIGLGALALVSVIWFVRRGPSAIDLARQAAKSGDLGALLKAIADLPAAARSPFFHAAIGYLWSNWQRPLAAALTREYVEQCPDEKLCQYWMKQVLEVEPHVARETFDEPFLATFFRPEVAKSCGSGGS